jgi:hypothetical protein
MSKNLETLMESRLLDDLPHDVMKALSAYIRNQQTLKAPFVRKGGCLDALVDKWSAWLEMQDIPTAIVPRTAPIPIRTAQSKSSPPVPGSPPPVTPTDTTALSMVVNFPPSAGSLSAVSLKRKPSAVKDHDDGIFTMDDDPPMPVVQLPSAPDVPRPSPWKSNATEKVDMKAIIEEEQRSRVPARRGDSDASDSSPGKWVVNRGLQQREKGRGSASAGPSIESSGLGRHASAENLAKNAVPSAPMQSQAVPRPSDSPWRPSDPQVKPQVSSAFPALSTGKTPALEQKRPNINPSGSSQGPLFTPTKTPSSSTVKRTSS